MRSTRSRMRLVRPTPVSSIAALATLAVIIGTAAFLVSSYPTLPDLLPVRFNLRGRPIGWQRFDVTDPVESASNCTYNKCNHHV